MPNDEIEPIIEYTKSQEDNIRHDKKLIDIYEGDLLSHVEAHLKEALSVQAYNNMHERIAPVNILQRLVDKLSKIYQQKPSRIILDGTDRDSELLVQYEQSFRINKNMNISNEFFNMNKASLVQSYLHQGRPRLRAIPNDKFVVYSNDKVDPTNVTHVVLFAGERMNAANEIEKIYHIYSDERFWIVNDKGDVLSDLMAMSGNPDGLNKIGKIPFVYVNKSPIRLVPEPDSDLLRMTILIPVLLSDLNYAIKFQTFSLLFGIDLDDDQISIGPNVFLRFKSDPASEGKAQFGTVKPEVDIKEVMDYIQGLLALWLNTKGIRPGAIGTTNAESFSSGISKMIDEMDTYEIREKQVQIYKDAEAELWDLVVNYQHPFYVKNRLIETNQLFSIGAEVVTNFREQIPMVRRGEVVKDLKEEVMAGFISRERALKKLNPHMTDVDVTELMKEIEEERFGEEEEAAEEVVSG